MIYDTLQNMLEQLNSSLRDSGEEVAVIMGNVASLQLDEDTDVETADHPESVVLSLVNVTEELALRSETNLRRTIGRSAQEERPLNLNLHLLFSATHKAYGTALRQISRIILYFHNQPVIMIHTTAEASEDSLSEQPSRDLRVSMELQSLTLDQVNHLWGSLGGRQVPFVLYRARVVAVAPEET